MELFDQLPQGVVVPCNAIDVRLTEERHPFEIEYKDEINANWQSELSANPQLFNGRVTLASAASLDNEVLTGATHEIDFATFLYWRKSQNAKTSCHIFAFAVPVTQDGALVAVKMSSHTANPGRIYFAAGSFEKCDFSNGRMDFVANTHRELFEETGLNCDHVPHDQNFGLIRFGAAVLIFRRYFLSADADEVAEAIRAFIAAEPVSEIEEPVILRKGDLPNGTLRHVPPLLDWHFREGVG
jgi:8-oxo-dGTP pyrophosphatase MutT (NUDIX family)